MSSCWLLKSHLIEGETDYLIAKDMLIRECINLKSNQQTNEDEAIEPQSTEADEFFISYASRRQLRRNSIEVNVEDEVSKYLTDSRENHDILNEYTNVKNVFFRHNTTLSASAAVERLFSQSQLIFTPRRNRLLSDNFERLLFVKHNMTLLDQME